MAPHSTEPTAVIPQQGFNGVSKRINHPSPTDESPQDSVVLDKSAVKPTSMEGLINLKSEIPKSDALRQPLLGLMSRLTAGHDNWPAEVSLSQNIEQFLDYVAANRLKHMPHKGSKWDKILQRSVAFASQLRLFVDVVSVTILDSAQASEMVYSCIHALLEVCTLTISAMH